MTLELTILGIILIIVALVVLKRSQKKVDLSFLDPKQPVDYPKEDE